MQVVGEPDDAGKIRLDAGGRFESARCQGDLELGGGKLLDLLLDVRAGAIDFEGRGASRLIARLRKAEALARHVEGGARRGHQGKVRDHLVVVLDGLPFDLEPGRFELVRGCLRAGLRGGNALEARQIDERHAQGRAAVPLIARNHGDGLRRLARRRDVDRGRVLVARVRAPRRDARQHPAQRRVGLRLLLREIRPRLERVGIALPRAGHERLHRLERQRGKRIEQEQQEECRRDEEVSAVPLHDRGALSRAVPDRPARAEDLRRAPRQTVSLSEC